MCASVSVNSGSNVPATVSMRSVVPAALSPRVRGALLSRATWDCASVLSLGN